MITDTLVVDVSQDWATACDIQQRFMAHGTPISDGSSYAARCLQLRAIGGDCYDFLPLAHNQLAFAIGDASGKSLPAALMIANVQSSVRTAALFVGHAPAAVLNAVNRQLHTASLADRFATLFYGVFDSATRVLRYANAGHNPPIVVWRDTSIVKLETTGLPLGMFTDSTYEEASIQLHPGDRVIAYTDGVVEALNPSGQEWGIAGIHTAAVAGNAKRADELVDAIFTSLDEFSCARQTDDATIAVLRVN